jgi:TFIIF-interacting CTD phosphatase-like protein
MCHFRTPARLVQPQYIDALVCSHKLYRDSCLQVDGNYLKDLNVLGRDLTKTLLVDNSPHAFGYQVRSSLNS